MSQQLRVCNIVATFRCRDITDDNYRLDLVRLAERFAPSASYDARRFSALVYRNIFSAANDGEKITALIFASMRVVVCGARSTENAERAAHTIVERLRDVFCGGRFAVENFTVQNIVGSFKCPHRVDLPRLYERLRNEVRGGGYCLYEPETYGALRYKYGGGGADSNIVFMVFYTGSTIVTGAKTIHQLATVTKYFYDAYMCKCLTNKCG